MLTEGSIRWFGPTWGQDPRMQIEVPVGESCGICRTEFDECSQGVRLPRLTEEGEDAAYAAYHIRCFLVSVLEARMAADVIARNPGIN